MVQDNTRKNDGTRTLATAIYGGIHALLPPASHVKRLRILKPSRTKSAAGKGRVGCSADPRAADGRPTVSAHANSATRKSRGSGGNANGTLWRLHPG